MRSSHQILLRQLQKEGITHPLVLKALSAIPREAFVLPHQDPHAYDNTALPIHCQQTISQPYIVGLMTQVLFQHPHPKRILEIGTGSGYQAAILAFLFKEVWTIERIPFLHQKAQETLRALGLNVHCRLGNGAEGWPSQAPFDVILVTAAASHPPKALLQQLEPQEGFLVIPLGSLHQVQTLSIVKPGKTHPLITPLIQVQFVPLIDKEES